MKLFSILSAGLIAAGTIVVSTWAAPGQAQESAVAQARYFCMPHQDAVDKLQKRFEERVVAMGLGQDQKSVIEIFVSQKGSWTILMTLNNGMSCITAAGQNWTDMPETDDSVS